MSKPDFVAFLEAKVNAGEREVIDASGSYGGTPIGNWRHQRHGVSGGEGSRHGSTKERDRCWTHSYDREPFPGAALNGT